METSVPTNTLDKLLRHYSERREEDLVLRIRYRKEEAGECVVYQLEEREELTN